MFRRAVKKLRKSEKNPWEMSEKHEENTFRIFINFLPKSNIFSQPPTATRTYREKNEHKHFSGVDYDDFHSLFYDDFFSDKSEMENSYEK
jgi:hypothetical protein